LVQRLNGTVGLTKGAAEGDLEFIGEELWSFDLESAVVRTIIGPLVFCVGAHTGNHELLLQSLRYHLQLLESRSATNLFLASPSNHDTLPPRKEYWLPLLATLSFLPGAAPAIFSGLEHRCQLVVNKEFGFNTSPELLHLRARLRDTQLALFNDAPLDWDSLETEIAGQPSALRELERVLAARHLTAGLELPRFVYTQWGRNETERSHCFGYERWSADGSHALIACVNWDRSRSVDLALPYGDGRVLLQMGVTPSRNRFVRGESLELGPLSVLVFLASVHPI
jgi:hypothetical protein